MKVLLVEPYAHTVSHAPQYARDVSSALASAGAEVTLLTFDGLLGDRERHSAVRTVSVTGQAGRFGGALRAMSKALHRTVVIPAPDSFVTLFCAAWWQKRQRCQVIHLLDDALPMLSPFFLGNLVRGCAIVITLHNPYREQDLLDGWGNKFSKSIARRDWSMAYRLLMAKALGSQGVEAFRGFLYRRANRRNRLSFICLSDGEQQSYAGAPFASQTVMIPEAKPAAAPVDRKEARRKAGIPDGDTVFLCFGVNHDWKSFL